MNEHFYNFPRTLLFCFLFSKWKLILIFQRQIATNGNNNEKEEKLKKHSPL